MYKTWVNWEKHSAEPFCLPSRLFFFVVFVVVLFFSGPLPTTHEPQAKRLSGAEQLLRLGSSGLQATAGQGGSLQRRAVSCRPRLARLRRSLAPNALTRGRSRKETAPKRGGSVVSSRAAAAPTSPRLLCVSLSCSMSGLRVYSTSVTGSREDYELFVEAVEQNTLQEFLKLA
ncbi:SH3 domain-binding glutamic acid-rich-like protein 3 isoform X2 [Peromyscus eremicus]|nr:SH3 domain-binding glutamic acid-rich-like protein 3 isoform X2 [Peromyscus eremicus]